ncbi:MAG TPA: dephospho-CoA kinase [Burkholderiaceae bacterium]|nr:dephospho-CoA kinase [Burkholderiaceae bacterium]
MSAAFGVGLTGGVGSGKSTIAAMLSKRGAGVVDADAIAHELTRPGGSAIDALRESFGPDAISADGSLDRARMRTRVFADPSARKQLESLLHPLIRLVMHERVVKLMADGSLYAVFVVPLLIEGGNWQGYVDRILLIDCSEAAQLARVCTRAGIDESTARKIIASQASRQQRLFVADDVLLNEAPLNQIELRVERLHQAYLRSVKNSSDETL